jgi:hypothetical protein
MRAEISESLKPYSFSTAVVCWPGMGSASVDILRKRVSQRTKQRVEKQYLGRGSGQSGRWIRLQTSFRVFHKKISCFVVRVVHHFIHFQDGNCKHSIRKQEKEKERKVNNQRKHQFLQRSVSIPLWSFWQMRPQISFSCGPNSAGPSAAAISTGRVPNPFFLMNNKKKKTSEGENLCLQSLDGKTLHFEELCIKLLFNGTNRDVLFVFRFVHLVEMRPRIEHVCSSWSPQA